MLAAAMIVTGMFAAAPTALRRINAMAMLPLEARPIQLNLKDLELPAPPPPDPEPPKRLIDPGAPTDAPPQDSDLISSQASRAQDMSDQQGDPNRAAVDEVDEFDQLGANATPPAPELKPVPPVEQEPPAPLAEPAPETMETAPETTEPPPADEPKPETQAPAEPEPKAEQVAAAAPPAPPKEEPAGQKPPVEKPAPEAPASERFKVAQATPPPRIQTQELRAEKGREGGGAMDEGVTSFAANKHALGEYMLAVRRRVERSWRTALHLRYTGASRTDAIIHCVIRPDGTIESVSIVDAGSSLTYAVLCREAVENAGPFEPFPFDVPEIYRTENLEINWKFSYL